MRFPEFCGASYRAQSLSFSPAMTKNWFPEPAASREAKSPSVLMPIPGARRFATSLRTGGRGMFAISDKLFAVQADKFVEYDAVGIETVRGTVAVDEFPATMCGEATSSQVLISSGNNGYVWNWATATFAQVRTGGTRMVDTIDGFGLALDVQGNQWFYSTLFDFTAWDPTDVVQRAGAGDPWVAIKVAGSTIWVIGTETCEPWYNAGGEVLPFARHPAGVQQVGIAAPFSVADVAGSATWVGRTQHGVGPIVRTEGYTPTSISDFAVAAALEDYERRGALANAYVSVYGDAGHLFYTVHFPNAPASHTYDAIVRRWSERGTWYPSLGRYGVWRPGFNAYSANRHYFSDPQGDGIYFLDPTCFTDVEDLAIVYERVARGPFEDHNAIGVSEFGLYLESGLPAHGVSATLMLQVSGDGGRTWGNARWKSAGLTGNYKARPRWQNLGTRSDWAFKLRVSSAFPPRVVDAYLTLNGETS